MLVRKAVIGAALGLCLFASAQARGHVVTLFNRGRTHPDLFPEVERLRGDREGDLAALEWARSLPPGGREARFGRLTIPPAMTREREAELLRAWHARSVARA